MLPVWEACLQAWQKSIDKSGGVQRGSPWPRVSEQQTLGIQMASSVGWFWILACVLTLQVAGGEGMSSCGQLQPQPFPMSHEEGGEWVSALRVLVFGFIPTVESKNRLFITTYKQGTWGGVGPEPYKEPPTWWTPSYP